MNTSLIRAAMGSLLLGGFLHLSFAEITAQDSAQDFVQDLGSSVVQAEKPTHAILDGLREDDDLKKDALERELSTTIAETIKNEPDVAIRSMGPAAARPVIKGLSGSHVEITEDGAFSGDMSATSPDHAVASEVLTAHRLRVLRGPHILAHSFSAAGGVVQVERNDIPFGDSSFNEVPFHGYVTGYSESAQPGYATAVGANTSVMGISLKGELSARKMGDMETPDGTLENTNVENGSGAVGAAYALGRFRFGASYRWFNSDYGIPGGFIGGHPNGVDIEMWKRDLTLRGIYLPANDARDTLEATLRINHYHHKEFEGSRGAVGAEFAVNQKNLRLEKLLANLGPLFGIRLGVELERRWIEMGGYVFTPPTQSYAGSAFAVASTSGWRGLEITLAARIGGAFLRPHESVVADKDAIEDRNFGLWALDVEFSQRVGVGKFLTLEVFRTTRAPTIEELYNQGPHLAAYTYERGNHKLDAESGFGGELEYRAYGEHLNARGSAYGTWFLNHLAPRATGDTNWSQLLPIYQVRGDEALLYGASASVETAAEQGFRAATSASYVRGVYRGANNSNSKGADGKKWSDMPQIPPLKFHGDVGYIWEHVRTAALIVNDMGSINVDAEILKKNGSNVAECPMFELQNGCICCTLRDEFIEQVEKISKLDSIEVVFVEASGISDPGAVSASFLAYEEDNPKTNVYLTSIVTVVDADRIYREFLSDLKHKKEQRDQLADQYDLSQEERTRFMDFVNNRYPSELIRSKGYIWFSDASRDVQLFEQAGRNSSVMPVSFWIDALREDQKQAYLAENPEVRENWDSRYGDRENQVVFIGKGYNKDSIRMELEKCLD